MSNIGYSRYDEPNTEWVNDIVFQQDEVLDMKQKMQNILATVYGNNDIEDLEYELEQLASYFNMRLPAEPFKLKRTTGEKND